ncbi:hypothetical protein SpCBS45565_g04434 [Spizellomyces sp. 'palustris']|nr:hypothetical protein SpCBS45565_g04434 [Spizellomyces sp. 'palustris']
MAPMGLGTAKSSSAISVLNMGQPLADTRTGSISLTSGGIKLATDENGGVLLRTGRSAMNLMKLDADAALPRPNGVTHSMMNITRTQSAAQVDADVTMTNITSPAGPRRPQTRRIRSSANLITGSPSRTQPQSTISMGMFGPMSAPAELLKQQSSPALNTTSELTVEVKPSHIPTPPAQPQTSFNRRRMASDPVMSSPRTSLLPTLEPQNRVMSKKDRNKPQSAQYDEQSHQTEAPEHNNDEIVHDSMESTKGDLSSRLMTSPKPIWRPGGTDLQAREEFVRNRNKARALAMRARKENKSRRARKRYEDDDSDEDEDTTDEEVAKEGMRVTFAEDNERKSRASRGRKLDDDRPDTASTIQLPIAPILRRRSIVPRIQDLEIPTAQTYDAANRLVPTPSGAYPRLSKPPKARKRTGGEEDDVEVEEEATVEARLPPSQNHTLRTIFLNDFTILSTHATTLQDIEMQYVLRDVDAIGMKQQGWTERTIDASDVPNMCWNLFKYLRCGDAGVPTKKGLLPDDAAGRVLTLMGKSGSTDQDKLSFIRSEVFHMDRKRYLFLKAIIGHIHRLSRINIPHQNTLIISLSSSFAPLILPQKYCPPSSVSQPQTPLIKLSDLRPVPGFRPQEATEAPPLSPLLPTLSVAELTEDDEREIMLTCLTKDDFDKCVQGDWCCAPLTPQATALELMANNFEVVFG